MKVYVMGWRAALVRAASVCGVAMLLASCGGGEQVQRFFATRVFAFGDESSVINPDRSKYTINAVATDGTYDCATNLLWVQSVASLYGTSSCLRRIAFAVSELRNAMNRSIAGCFGESDFAAR